MAKQLSLLEVAMLSDNLVKKKRKVKRNWEYAFQKWSNEQAEDERTSTGICGWGAMCDWCYDNTYGKPCVRALNKMCREKRIAIDYSKRDFEKIWRGEI
jgi:hypothetical protein